MHSFKFLSNLAIPVRCNTRKAERISSTISAIKRYNLGLLGHTRSILVRTMSTAAKPTTATSSSDILRDMQEFRKVLPEVVGEITNLDVKYSDVRDISKWLQEVLNYNLRGGKNNRGLSLLISYKKMEKPENLTDENLLLASKLGWCIELFQSYFLVLDDIMDDSITRRGVPCWFRQPHVGLNAINDALLIKSSLWLILKKNFGEKPYYKDILNLFNEILFNTAIGQHMDLTTNQGDKLDLEKITMDRYKAIVKYKTAFYTYLLPIRLCCCITGVTDKDILQLVDKICLDIGLFFQIQDDFLDCYGDASVTGKIGTDIQEGKCSWLAVKALQLCNDKQYDLMKQHYGSKDKQHIQQILDLYKELNVKQAYYDYEESAYNSIRNDINKLPNQLSHDLFYTLLDKIYKRQS